MSTRTTVFSKLEKIKLLLIQTRFLGKYLHVYKQAVGKMSLTFSVNLVLTGQLSIPVNFPPPPPHLHSSTPYNPQTSPHGITRHMTLTINDF
jgi:hypothetical protein